MLISKYGAMAGTEKVQALYLNGSNAHLSMAVYAGIQRMTFDAVVKSYDGTILYCQRDFGAICGEIYAWRWKWNYYNHQDVTHEQGTTVFAKSGPTPSSEHLGRIKRFDFNMISPEKDSLYGYVDGQCIINLDTGVSFPLNYRTCNCKMFEGCEVYLLNLTRRSFNNFESGGYVWANAATYDFTSMESVPSWAINGEFVEIRDTR